MQINLVATQMVVDREHSNRVIFTPEMGMDPAIDLSLVGSQLRALVQGRASTWQQHLTLTPTSAPPGEAVSTLLNMCPINVNNTSKRRSKHISHRATLSGNSVLSYICGALSCYAPIPAPIPAY